MSFLEPRHPRIRGGCSLKNFLRRPAQARFDRVKVMDRIGPAAALFTEGEPEQGAAAAHQALDEATRVNQGVLWAVTVRAILSALMAASGRARERTPPPDDAVLRCRCHAAVGCRRRSSSV